MIKAEKIRKETLFEFLENHPELTISADKKGNIIQVIFPENAENPTFTNVLGIITISYYCNGELVKFPTE